MPCVTEDPEASGGTVLVPPILPLDALLPIRAAVVTLAFTAAAAPRFFHQPAVTAFLRTLLGGPEDYDLLLTMDCPETGRIAYRAGDRYRFTLFALAGGEALLDRALAALRRLPESFPLRDPGLPLRDNISFIELRDLFNGEPVRSTGDLSLYDETALVREAALWAHAEPARLRFLAPARLLLDKPQRGTRRGEARYCRNGRELSLTLFFCRLHDSFADLLRRRGVVPPPRPPAPVLPAPGGHLFWVDASYRDAAGREQAMGGLTGLLDLPADPRPSLNLWRLLVLGQYTGIGQRRAFGFGRYRLETGNGDWTAARADPAASLLELAAEPDNLLMAYQAIEDNRRARRPRPEEREEWEADPGEDEDALEDEGPDEDLADRLGRLSARLRGGGYRPPALRGFVLEGADGKPRPLAVPPYLDRIAQRAVTQVLTPALDELMAPGSHGYRRGRSRHSAARAIEAAYARGCRFVYEADIDDFFDSVDWRRLGITLAALLGDDPVVERVLSWVAAPVEYRGTAIPRREGLPQGAPLSRRSSPTWCWTASTGRSNAPLSPRCASRTTSSSPARPRRRRAVPPRPRSRRSLRSGSPSIPTRAASSPSPRASASSAISSSMGSRSIRPASASRRPRSWRGVRRRPGAGWRACRPRSRLSLLHTRLPHSRMLHLRPPRPRPRRGPRPPSPHRDPRAPRREPYCS